VLCSQCNYDVLFAYLTSHNCKQSCQLRTFALRHSPPATRVSPTSRLTLLCHPILVFVDDFAYAFCAISKKFCLPSTHSCVLALTSVSCPLCVSAATTARTTSAPSATSARPCSTVRNCPLRTRHTVWRSSHTPLRAELLTLVLKCLVFAEISMYAICQKEGNGLDKAVEDCE
jgi:hypothetical protein